MARTRFSKALDKGDPDVMLRKCLGCDYAFLSEWKGNRICPVCTETNQRNNIHGEQEYKVVDKHD